MLQQQQNLGRRFGTSKMHLSATSFGCCPFYSGGSSVAVDSWLIVTPRMGFCNCSMFCCSLLCVHSSFAMIFMGRRELDAWLVCLSGVS